MCIRDRFRIFLISILVLISLASILYFHVILHLGTVYTHFFYFPIILASLWWGRRGISVSVLLSAALVAAHVYTRRYDASPDDLIRAGTFILVSVVVAMLSERAALARERMRHFNLVLRSIRDINHLIIKEKDQDRLIRGICEKLVRNRSYHFAWIALMDDHGRLVASAVLDLEVCVAGDPLAGDHDGEDLTTIAQEPVERRKACDAADQGNAQRHQQRAPNQLDGLCPSNQQQDAIDHRGNQRDVYDAPQIQFRENPQEFGHDSLSLEQSHEHGLLRMQAVLGLVP